MRLLFLCLLAGLLCACTGAPVLFGSQPPTVKATPDIAALEHAMFARLNRDRTAAGLGRLTYDERLADVGRAHSLDMQQHDFFAHESPSTGVLEDRMDRAGVLAVEMRENLAAAGDVERAEDNLLKSPGHRANIMAPGITHVGIGIVRGDAQGDDRVLIITQVFAKPTAVESPEATRAAVVSMIHAARRKRGLPALENDELLGDLAEDHIDELPDEILDGTVADVGEQVSRQLSDEQGHDLVSVQIAAQAVFTAADFELPDALADPGTTKMGLATVSSKDERGRPRVKVLVLLGRTR